MSIYLVGDVQGCYRSLRQLMRQCGFNPGRDRLWLAGDLVNRGPRSLEVLRWVKDLGPAATVVLGNHDLHLVALAHGVSELREGDTLEAVLRAPDRDPLIAWLMSRPLVHREDDLLMVHAGLLPRWTWEEAEGLAREFEAILEVAPERLVSRGGGPSSPTEEAQRVALGALTRLRCVDAQGNPVRFDGAPEDRPEGTEPWFSHPARVRYSGTVVFGHWAALGHRVGPDWISLDSGCVWGGALTAMRWEDRAVFRQAAID